MKQQNVWRLGKLYRKTINYKDKFKLAYLKKK